LNLKLRALVGLVAIAAVGAIGSGTAGASTTATQYFTASQTSVDGPITVVASGPIAATGTDLVETNHRDRFVFPQGDVIVKHEATSSRESFDPETCVGTFSERGRYTVVRGSNAYRGVSGSGRYKAFAIFQGCDPNEPPTSFALVILAHGPLTLP
jgi:hypothetical protein